MIKVLEKVKVDMKMNKFQEEFLQEQRNISILYIDIENNEVMFSQMKTIHLIKKKLTREFSFNKRKKINQ